MRLNFHLLDVFSDRQFGGNPLAVFPDPPLDLPAGAMQQIAKELNLSETTFVFPPTQPKNDFRLRIFTPAAELPMAGHPTVGSAYLLAKLGRTGDTARASTITFEEGVGPIEVTIHRDQQGNPAEVWMRQPIPQFLDILRDRAAIAEILSLREDDLVADAPLQVLSSGLPFLFVVVQSLQAMASVRLQIDKWQDRLAGTNAQNIFVTTTETQFPGATVHSRMFAPALGVAEDPATGSASGPLGAYLLHYGLVSDGELVSEQGVEMGRPSFIRIRVERRGDSFTEVAIGGACAYMGHGTLLLD